MKKNGIMIIFMSMGNPTFVRDNHSKLADLYGQQRQQYLHAELAVHYSGRYELAAHMEIGLRHDSVQRVHALQYPPQASQHPVRIVKSIFSLKVYVFLLLLL